MHASLKLVAAINLSDMINVMKLYTYFCMYVIELLYVNTSNRFTKSYINKTKIANRTVVM